VVERVGKLRPRRGGCCEVIGRWRRGQGLASSVVGCEGEGLEDLG